ncbi:MAG: hypothetical protein ACKO0Z_26840 [Betaproteobacteria bacterium]
MEQAGVRVDLIAYDGRHVVRFLTTAALKYFKYAYDLVVCVNHQSIPLLFIFSYFGKSPTVYWKLETYNLPFYSGLIPLLESAERFCRRSKVDLVAPSLQRLDLQMVPFRSHHVVYNAPDFEYVTDSPRHLRKDISLVLYGNMRNPKNVYMQDWIDAIKNESGLNLTIIGAGGEPDESIDFMPAMEHPRLIALLSEPDLFNFSIVGYRPVDVNTRYAAPNKAIESLACGLPLIGHIENDYVCKIIDRFKCGVIIDFNNIGSVTDALLAVNYEESVRNSLVAAKELCLGNAVQYSPLWVRS